AEIRPLARTLDSRLFTIRQTHRQVFGERKLAAKSVCIAPPWKTSQPASVLDTSTQECRDDVLRRNALDFFCIAPSIRTRSLHGEPCGQVFARRLECNDPILINRITGPISAGISERRSTQ